MVKRDLSWTKEEALPHKSCCYVRSHTLHLKEVVLTLNLSIHALSGFIRDCRLRESIQRHDAVPEAVCAWSGACECERS